MDKHRHTSLLIAWCFPEAISGVDRTFGMDCKGKGRVNMESVIENAITFIDESIVDRLVVFESRDSYCGMSETAAVPLMYLCQTNTRMPVPISQLAHHRVVCILARRRAALST